MRRALSVGTRYFAIIFAAGFVLGVLRTVLLLPRLGEVGAVLLELPVILWLCWWVAGWLLRRWPMPLRARLMAGIWAFGLLMLAEYLLGSWVFGRSPAQHLAHWASLHGALGLAGQVAFALLPALRGRG